MYNFYNLYFLIILTTTNNLDNFWRWLTNFDKDLPIVKKIDKDNCEQFWDIWTILDIFNTFEELYDFEECVPKILFLKLVVPQCPIVRGSHGLSAKVRKHEGPLARGLAPEEAPDF